MSNDASGYGIVSPSVRWNVPVRPRELEAPVAEGQCRVRQVDAVHLGAMARILRQHIAVAAADIEHALAGRARVAVDAVRELPRFAVGRLAQRIELREESGAAGLGGDAGGGDRVRLPERADPFVADRLRLHGFLSCDDGGCCEMAVDRR